MEEIALENYIEVAFLPLPPPSSTPNPDPLLVDELTYFRRYLLYVSELQI